MRRNILYVVRSLDIGGLEQVVVDLANHIDKARYRSYICCIARAGELVRNVQDRESLFVIGNEGRVNIGSMKYLHDLVRRHAIDLVHRTICPACSTCIRRQSALACLSCIRCMDITGERRNSYSGSWKKS